MSKADESVLAKCLSILRITTQRSTDDEVARQVAIHKLQVNCYGKSSASGLDGRDG